MYPHHFDYRTHAVFTGSTGYGKTAGIEDCERDRYMVGEGQTIFCFDQNHHDRFLNFLIHMRPRRPVYLINPSESKAIVPCNFFSYPSDPSHAERLALAIAGAGEMRRNLNDMKIYSAMMSAVIHWCAESGKPIQSAMRWLRYKGVPLPDVKHETAAYTISLLKRPIKLGDWSFRAGSTMGRLQILYDSLPLRRFTGTKGAFNVRQAVKEKATVLVNLTPTAGFTFEAATMFAGLLLSEYGLAEGRHFIDLDEAPFYVGYEVVQMLDLMGKKGLRLTLICHDPRQFDDPRLSVSLEINAKIRMLFGGMTHEQRKRYVPDFYPSELHSFWEKQALTGLHGRIRLRRLRHRDRGRVWKFRDPHVTFRSPARRTGDKSLRLELRGKALHVGGESEARQAAIHRPVAG